MSICSLAFLKDPKGIIMKTNTQCEVPSLHTHSLILVSCPTNSRSLPIPEFWTLYHRFFNWVTSLVSALGIVYRLIWVFPFSWGSQSCSAIVQQINTVVSYILYSFFFVVNSETASLKTYLSIRWKQKIPFPSTVKLHNLRANINFIIIPLWLGFSRKQPYIIGTNEKLMLF